MKFKIGDVVLVKMTIQKEDDFGGYTALLAHASRFEELVLLPGDIFALVSRKPKKEKPSIRAGSHFVDHPEEAKGAFQPAKWSKLDMGEPFYPDLLAEGWKFGSLPNDARKVQVILGDGTKCNGSYHLGAWLFIVENTNVLSTPTNLYVLAWKELDKS